MGCFCVTELEYGPCQRTCGLAEEGLCQAWMRDISVCVCGGRGCAPLFWQLKMRAGHLHIRKEQTLQLGRRGSGRLADSEVLVLQALARHFLSPGNQLGQRRLRCKYSALCPYVTVISGSHWPCLAHLVTGSQCGPASGLSTFILFSFTRLLY